jgi:2,4-dienoyl-CoA reductase-like NADH-dependent reductase (Old Yellow Enzyme family)
MTIQGIDLLLEAFDCGALHLKNRVVMAPMTRCFSPGGVPGPDVAAYYKRRAEHDVGLILTEATPVPHIGAASDANAPTFYGDAALRGWAWVLHEVHAAGGKIMPQFCHNGLMKRPKLEGIFSGDCGLDRSLHMGPSGIAGGQGFALEPGYRGMSQKDIDSVIEAYATAAFWALQIGFDGVEVHAAHGYLPDQFLWGKTNQRRDKYGGSIKNRARFTAEIIAEMRLRLPREFPILLRISQWKVHDYAARIGRTPRELESLLRSLVDAGVDIIDCSQRRYWEPEFEGSPLNLAGWVKKLSGRPTMTVGSVSLSNDTLSMLEGQGTEREDIEPLLTMLRRGDFDLVAVGRGLLVDPDWISRIRRGGATALSSYSASILGSLH